jgi:hypothetical protein
MHELIFFYYPVIEIAMNEKIIFYFTNSKVIYVRSVMYKKQKKNVNER